MKSQEDIVVPLFQDIKVDQQIDEAKYVEKLPYSKVFKDLSKVAPMTTIVGFLMLSY